jgi:outer membrane receptor protein involved in Fe transport
MFPATKFGIASSALVLPRRCCCCTAAPADSTFDFSATYRLGNYRLGLVVENLTDTDWDEAQFDTESRLRGEPAPVSELHFTPGNPRNVRAGVSYSF